MSSGSDPDMLAYNGNAGAGDSDDEFAMDEPSFNDKKKTGNSATGKELEKKTEYVDNQHYDAKIEISDGGSEDDINSNSEDDEMSKGMMDQGDSPAKEGLGVGAGPDDESSSDDDDPAQITHHPGGYNPEDYADLDVSSEISELFQYINRYKPNNIELDTKLKAFIPDYIPAVGEVDAFIKVPRPDKASENLGLTVLDEPCLNLSDPVILDYVFGAAKVRKRKAAHQQVRCIESADKNPQQISRWIETVGAVQKGDAPVVQYSKHMPEVEDLMAEWPAEIDQMLSEITLPNAELAVDVATYSKIICAILDIPIHNVPNSKKSVVESLHVLFSLYSAFKDNPHFQRNQEENPNNFAAGGQGEHMIL